MDNDTSERSPKNLYQQLRDVEHFHTQDPNLEDSILSFRANSQDIVSWYFSQDPLQEAEGMAAAVANRTGNPEIAGRVKGQYFLRALAYEKAAATLVADVFVPEVFEKGSAAWYEEMDKLFSKEAPEIIANPDAHLSVDDIIGFCLIKKGEGRNYSNGQLQQLFLAAEMLTVAAVAKEPRLVRLANGRETTAESIDLLFGRKIFNLIHQTTATEREDTERMLLGIDSAWNVYASLAAQRNVSLFSGDTEHKQQYDSMEQMCLNFMTTHLEGVFIQGGLLKKDKFTKEIQGKLHELVWLLDALMFLRIKGDHSINVFPTVSFQDRPIIGKPDVNRGFDFFMYNLPSENHRFVQLKSIPNPRSKKSYHPLISTYYEQNFQDVNPGRLHLKMEAYRKLIAAGFHGDERDTKRAMDYILPSVQEALGDFIQNPEGAYQRMEELYQITDRDPMGIALNRATRRELQRAVKRQRRH